MFRRGLTRLSGLLGIALLVWWPTAHPHPLAAPINYPKIYDFELTPTSRAPGARGKGQLTLGWSPFGVAVNVDGYLVYDLEITASGLIDPTRQAMGSAYVAWISSPDLTRIEKLGGLPDGSLTTRISSWNKFLLLVTLESDPAVETRTGPVVLRGRSPSGFMASFQSHELFNLIPH